MTILLIFKLHLQLRLRLPQRHWHQLPLPPLQGKAKPIYLIFSIGVHRRLLVRSICKPPLSSSHLPSISLIPSFRLHSSRFPGLCHLYSLAQVLPDQHPFLHRRGRTHLLYSVAILLLAALRRGLMLRSPRPAVTSMTYGICL